MNLQDNDLWKAFVEEVHEQLDFLESELVDAATADMETIHNLFRYFHSIKSSSAIFQFAAMEELAHAAESILDRIRQHLLQPDDTVINLLLATTDTLKGQLKEAVRTLQPPSRNMALLGQLQIQQEKPHTPDKPQAQTPDTDSNVLGIDTIQLDEFASLFCESMIDVFNAMEHGNHERIDPLLSGLARAAAVLDLSQFNRIVCQLRERFSAGTTMSPDTLLRSVFQLMDQVCAVEKLTGHCFGTDRLYDHLHALFSDDYLAALQATEQALLLCQHEQIDLQRITPQSLSQLCDCSDHLIRHFTILNLQGSTDLLRYFCQACRKAIVTGDFPDSGVFSMLHDILLEHVESVGEPLYQKMVDQRCSEAFRNFHNFLHRQADDRFHRQERIAELTTCLGLEPDFMDYVDNSEIELLENCIRENRCIAILVVDTESDPAWATRFLQWLHRHELVTSRTLFTRQESSIQLRESTRSSFLVAFDEPEDSIRASIMDLGFGEGKVEYLDFRFPRGQHTAAAPAGTPTAAAANLVDTHLFSGRQTAENDSGKTIRVNGDTIDHFVSQVGEMVLHRNMLSHVLSDSSARSILQVCRNMLEAAPGQPLDAEQLASLQRHLATLTDMYSQLTQAHDKLSLSISRVQKDVMTLRVVPVSLVFNRLPRVVRNINVSEGKDIRLQISGEHVRVDKSMVDVLMEPLIHLVRNCADHGIESADVRRATGKPAQALISVSAEQRGSHLEIHVADDGKGLDYERIRRKAVALGQLEPHATPSEHELKMMIFRPGFSTSDTVTETSGRGVGMDAVRTRIAAIGGSIEIESVPGTGTRFLLRLPVSAAIQGVILFRHDGETLTIPERNVTLALTLPANQIQSVQGQAAFIHQASIMPLYSLSQLLGWTHSEKLPAASLAHRSHLDVIIIANEECHIAITVDKVLDRQEVFVRELHHDLLQLPGVGGASILGNGQVAIILDAEALLQIASRQSQRIESILKVS